LAGDDPSPEGSVQMHFTSSGKPSALSSLDADIPVGYRVSSVSWTRLRISATRIPRKKEALKSTASQKDMAPHS
jgi:hypothetical protein